MKAKDREAEILHETENMWLNSKLELCLHMSTHSVIIGKAKTIEQAKRVMGKLELYPSSLEELRRRYIQAR